MTKTQIAASDLRQYVQQRMINEEIIKMIVGLVVGGILGTLLSIGIIRSIG